MDSNHGFPHVTRACRGVIFRTLETVRYYMSKTDTATGLTIEVRILEKVGARNELAKALAARGGLQGAAGDLISARKLLESALAIFEELGTLDEPPRVRAALAALASTPTG